MNKLGKEQELPALFLASLHFRRLPRALRYWVPLTGPGGLISSIQARDWLLLLNARHIPHRILTIRGIDHLYVPILLAELAKRELVAFAEENAQPVQRPVSFPLHRHWIFALFPMLLLLLCYFWQISPDHPLINISDGSLDGIRLWLHGEWWRLATALTLHVNLLHLCGNIAFGSLFLALLARYCGIGHAWLIACVGGMGGNFLSSLVHTLAYSSVGFSTAVFASIGAVAGLRLCQEHRRLFMPIASAIALLAMLGTEGAHTDYGAHICGLFCGLALGLLEGFAILRHIPLLPQWLAGAIALSLPLLAWKMAG